jgi:CDP-diglyceride synthetase
MNDKRIDKMIRSKIDIPEKVPSNINALFDSFIAENVKSESNRGIKIKNKMSIGRKILTAISSIASSLVIGGVVSIIGQIGDIIASALKRSARVKDYGTIFPGHGGVMDRVDGLIFNAFAVLICMFILL